MAENAPPTEAVAKLILDDVTGEEVSKTELKRRQKQRENERKKAEKAAAAPQKAGPKTTVDESQLTPNVVARFPSDCTIANSLAAIFRDQKWSCQRSPTEQATKSISS